MTPPGKKSRDKQDSNPGSSAPMADALTTRPARRCPIGNPGHYYLTLESTVKALPTVLHTLAPTPPLIPTPELYEPCFQQQSRVQHHLPMAMWLGVVGQLAVVSEGCPTPVTHVRLLPRVATASVAPQAVGTREPPETQQQRCHLDRYAHSEH